MSRHPAPDELLLDYATGVLPEGPALAVSLHVALDAAARRTVGRLAALGGALLEGEAGPDLGDAALDRVMAQLDGNKDWKRAFGGFEQIELGLHGDTHRVALLRLQPGKGLPVHRHVANEYTVVLQGGYTDNTGNYGVGDFAVGPGPQEHEPIADPGEPCIALIVVEKPIVLTGALGRWLNPLLRWGWM
jgi:putative transcriptional regulator